MSGMGIPFISEAVVDDLISVKEAIPVIEQAMLDQARGLAFNVPRQRIKVGDASLNMLAASWEGGSVYGQKVYSVGPGGAQFWVLLYHSDGRPLAIVEAQRLGQVRTGAATGVATRALANQDAHRVGLLGSGYQMRTQLEAICAVRPVDEVKAWSPTAERLNTFCLQMSDAVGVPVNPTRSATDAVTDVDIVVTLTTAKDPIVAADDIAHGTHVNVAGSNHATRREVHSDVVGRASCVVTDDLEQAHVESGDLLAAVRDGALHWNEIVRLADAVADPANCRKSVTDVTLFKSHGIGLWDVAVAKWVAEKAIATSRATEVELATGPDISAPARFHSTSG